MGLHRAGFHRAFSVIGADSEPFSQPDVSCQERVAEDAGTGCSADVLSLAGSGPEAWLVAEKVGARLQHSIQATTAIDTRPTTKILIKRLCPQEPSDRMTQPSYSAMITGSSENGHASGAPITMPQQSARSRCLGRWSTSGSSEYVLLGEVGPISLFASLLHYFHPSLFVLVSLLSVQDVGRDISYTTFLSLVIISFIFQHAFL